MQHHGGRKPRTRFGGDRCLIAEILPANFAKTFFVMEQSLLSRLPSGKLESVTPIALVHPNMLVIMLVFQAVLHGRSHNSRDLSASHGCNLSKRFAEKWVLSWLPLELRRGVQRFPLLRSHRCRMFNPVASQIGIESPAHQPRGHSPLRWN